MFKDPARRTKRFFPFPQGCVWGEEHFATPAFCPCCAGLPKAALVGWEVDSGHIFGWVSSRESRVSLRVSKAWDDKALSNLSLLLKSWNISGWKDPQGASSPAPCPRTFHDPFPPDVFTSDDSRCLSPEHVLAVVTRSCCWRRYNQRKLMA